MKITLFAPFETEATVDFNGKDRQVEVKPHLYTERGRGTIGYLEVKTDVGKLVHRYTLQASGKDGHLALLRRGAPVQSIFDKGVTGGKAAEAEEPANKGM